MKISIKQRIMIGFAGLIIMAVIMAIVCYMTIINISSLVKVVKENLEERIFIVEKERDHLDWVQGLTLYLMSDKKFTGQLDYRKCGLGQWLYSEATQNISDPELQKIFKEIEKPHIELHNSAKRIINAKESSNESDARRIFLESTMPSLISTREKLKQIIDRINKISVEVAGKAAEDMEGQADSSKTSVLIMSIVLIIFGLVFAIFLSQQIISTLGHVINKFKESSQSFTSASVQLAVSSQKLAQGSTEQASAIEETSSTLEESASMIQQTTENTKHASLLSKQVKDLSDKGNQEMQELTESMRELKNSSAQIGKIIKVIDDIAFQTNILALNAAIEAARAGEAGMGFAVVAEEVRSLAQRSAQAAKDTTNIIESNIGLSEKGMLVTETVNNSLIDINVQAKKVSELMEEITAASQEQYQGIDQVNKALAQMEVVVQQDSSSAEENAAAAEELNAHSQSIIEAINKLSTLITGKSR